MATSTDLWAAIEEVREAMPEGQAKPDLQEALRRAKESWTEKFEERIGALPWWAVSTFIHTVILAMAAVLCVAVPMPERLDRDIIIITEPAPPPPVIYEHQRRLPLLDLSRVPSPEPEDLTRPAGRSAPAPEEERPVLQLPAESDGRRELGPLSAIPLGPAFCTDSMRVSPGMPADGWGYIRRDAREALARRGGGGPEAIGAVDAALEWLARHQEADGHWDSRRHDLAETSRPARTTDRADTALALLAFLGSGHTPVYGKYQDNVRRAALWLLARQRPDGSFFEKTGGPTESAGYQQAICGLAVAELFGMTQDQVVGRAAQRAVDFSVKKHQKTYSGWRYDPGSDADLSVTGWFVMQLKSARVSGLRVDASAFQGAMQFLDKVTDARGRSGYTSRESVSPTMTAVGMLSRQFLGADSRDPAVRGAAEYLLEHPPQGGAKADPGTFYYWYYGTLAMFQYGGPEWRRWNAELKANLTAGQRADGDARGSWDPQGRYDRIGGRVYSTAMGALTLEVYYRYLQMHPR